MEKKVVGRPKKDLDSKANPNDRIKCIVCGLYYSRSNQSKHIKTKMHQTFLKVDEDIRYISFNKPNNEKKIMSAHEFKYNNAIKRFKQNQQLMYP